MRRIVDTMLIEKARRRDKRSQTTELKVNIDPLKSLQSINSYSAAGDIKTRSHF